MSDTTDTSVPDIVASGSRIRPRNIAFAQVWTAQSEPVIPTQIADALTARGFIPGFVAPDGNGAIMAETGLAYAEFVVGGGGWRVVSLSSSRGDGCRVSVRTTTKDDLPTDYLARRAVPNPKLLYLVEAGGAGNSDRNLCENIAEALMLLTDGLVEIGGLGAKGGNAPKLYKAVWLGSIRE